MSASVADDMIRSYFERWQRLEEEKRTISDDLKELFAEAKGNGLEAKALRTVFREQVGDKAAIEEFDAICDLYRASLNAPRAGRARESQSYAEAKGREDVDPKLIATVATGMQTEIGRKALIAALDVMIEREEAETGELTDTQEQPEEPATQSVQPRAPAVVSEYAGTSSDENPAPHSPSPVAAPRPQAIADDEAAQANPTSSAPIPNPQPASSPGVDMAGEPQDGNEPVSGSPASQFNNPRCQHPVTCSHAHDQGSCDDCFFNWAKRPLEEQRRLWAEAMEAASETEAAA